MPSVLRAQGKKVVGAKQTSKYIKSGKTITVYIARNADEKVRKPIEELCRQNDIQPVYIETMKELGNICGIDIGAATAALIDE